MKILVATMGKGGLEDVVSPIFGRCATFTIVDIEGEEPKEVKVIPNPYRGNVHGVGIQAAQFAVNERVGAVMAGTFGPNAYGVLKSAGIEVVSMPNMTVRDAVIRYAKGEVSGGVYGISSPGAMRGMGRGMGRGFGMGRQQMYFTGMQEQPRHRDCAYFEPPNICKLKNIEVNPDGAVCGAFKPKSFFNSKEQEIQVLNAEKKSIEARLEEIKARLKELEGD